MKKNSILFIFAHPDDETFTSGIAISKYAQKNETSLYLICATRGQAGKAGEPPLCTPDELPRYREKELREAASLLGMTAVDVWDYEDKYLGEVPMDELINRIHEAIEQLQPQVVVTFAPHGISGHPDHCAISGATTQAILRLPEDASVRKFYYVTHASSSQFGAIQPPYTDPYESITAVISGPEYVSQVASALRAHRTQHLSVERVFPGVTSGNAANVPTRNHFILAWSKLPQYVIEEKETDLFSGL